MARRLSLMCLMFALFTPAARAEVEAETTVSNPPPPSAPIKRVGGHLGIVVPVVTASTRGPVSSVADRFVIGITSGLGLSIIGKLSFDAELVTLIDTSNRVVNILIHPGLLFGPLGLTVGLRGA